MSKFNKFVEVSRERLDSWYNALTGLGNGLRDKVQSTQFVSAWRLTDDTLEALYHEDDMAARICDALPEEALRRGYGLSLEEDDNDLPEKMREYEKRLGFPEALLECAVWARVFGGAVIYLGIDDGLFESEPVNEERIKTIKFATVLDRRSIVPDTLYTDPENDAKFGQPKLYRLQVQDVAGSAGSGTLIHESRLIRLNGARTSLKRQTANNGWNESVLQKVNSVLTDFGTSWQAVGHLMQDAAQGVFKIQGLIDMIASGDKETLQSRMELVDMSRSVARSIMLDADLENFERQAYTFTGVPDILKAFMLRLSAAAKIPVVVLFGQSPSGLNATGDSDIRLWYDRVQSYQTNTLTPPIERMHNLILKAQDFEGEKPEKSEIQFERLWQMTDKEQAELEKSVAEKDRIYIDAGVLLPEEVAINRYPVRGFNMNTKINMDARTEMLEAEIALAKEKAGEESIPPPMPGQQPPVQEQKLPEDERADRVEKHGTKWVALSTTGKVLWTYDTEAAAKKQLRAIEAAKHSK